MHFFQLCWGCPWWPCLGHPLCPGGGSTHPSALFHVPECAHGPLAPPILCCRSAHLPTSPALASLATSRRGCGTAGGGTSPNLVGPALRCLQCCRPDRGWGKYYGVPTLENTFLNIKTLICEVQWLDRLTSDFFKLLDLDIMSCLEAKFSAWWGFVDFASHFINCTVYLKPKSCNRHVWTNIVWYV